MTIFSFVIIFNLTTLLLLLNMIWLDFISI